MEKLLYPITPQKKTLINFLNQEEHQLRDLSPLIPTIFSSFSKYSTKLQIMQSPLPRNQDLFLQLLENDAKILPINYLNQNQMETEYAGEFDEAQLEEQIEEQTYANILKNDEEEEESDGKIRKRKSTIQIHILKKQLDIQSIWNKQKIDQLSDITGLSQSQVYKWWWDQKKKNGKYCRNSFSGVFNRRKIIKKDFCKQSIVNYRENSKESAFTYEITEDQPQTRLKNLIDIQQVPETQKKVNKRLVF